MKWTTNTKRQAEQWPNQLLPELSQVIWPGESWRGLFLKTRKNRQQEFNTKRRSILARKS